MTRRSAVSREERCGAYVHGDTANFGPAVALDAVLVVGASGLEEGLVDAAAAGDDADGRARARRDGLLLTRREAHARLASALLRRTYRRGREHA
eukprot:3859323-Pleurochrysis_carterae.AAC.2